MVIQGLRLELADSLDLDPPTPSELRSAKAQAQPRCPNCGRFATYSHTTGSPVTYEVWEVFNCTLHGKVDYR